MTNHWLWEKFLSVQNGRLNMLNCGCGTQGQTSSKLWLFLHIVNRQFNELQWFEVLFGADVKNLIRKPLFVFVLKNNWLIFAKRIFKAIILVLLKQNCWGGMRFLLYLFLLLFRTKKKWEKNRLPYFYSPQPFYSTWRLKFERNVLVMHSMSSVKSSRWSSLQRVASH